ncbi:GFA family protein [Solimonas terrae]|uniref:GFA family protein n=1 Tax=Solimonas terrae TaxID=1396819 RepID=A0A6M2BNL7_9GAMM|nr:GFA family protein [Solimonas terrae]NGY03805.1 GFA family protein [Solimonas terrae]
MHTGSCLCGGVRFRISSALEPIQVCHCTQCRKAQGTPFATNTPVLAAAFELVSGAGLLAAFESSPGKRRVFCSKCGSPVYSSRDTLPGVLRIRAGLLDEPLAVQAAAHFHTASKAGWWPITDTLPRFEHALPAERPPLHARPSTDGRRRHTET